jgi:hypothetical protein
VVRPLVLTAVGVTLAWQHPLLRADRLACWDTCWQEGSSAAVRDRLRLTGDPLSVDWGDLSRVARYLKAQGLRDGELTCCDNFTHPLLLDLGLRPSTRYLHIDTLLHAFPSRREEFRATLEASAQRLVVSDLFAAGLPRGQAADGETGLPAGFPKSRAGLFPWTEPVVFRAGRYVVHRARGPVAPLFPDVKKRRRGGIPSRIAPGEGLAPAWR